MPAVAHSVTYPVLCCLLLRAVVVRVLSYCVCLTKGVLAC